MCWHQTSVLAFKVHEHVVMGIEKKVPLWWVVFGVYLLSTCSNTNCMGVAPESPKHNNRMGVARGSTKPCMLKRRMLL